MSQWGVFYDKLGYVHVAPSTPDGLVMVDHRLSPDCPCHPKPEYSEHDHILVHQDPERGGCNS
jgi:hypothetical protein